MEERSVLWTGGRVDRGWIGMGWCGMRSLGARSELKPGGLAERALYG